MPNEEGAKTAESQADRVKRLFGVSPIPTEEAVDFINQPPHYTSHPSGVECIEIVEHFPYNIGAAMKYLWRSAMKGQTEDLQKARWHINRELERMKKFGEMSDEQKHSVWKHVENFIADDSEMQPCEGCLDISKPQMNPDPIVSSAPPTTPSAFVEEINRKVDEFRERREARERASEAEDKFGGKE